MLRPYRPRQNAPSLSSPFRPYRPLYTYDRLNNVVKVEQVISSTSSQFTQYFYDTKNRLVRVYTGLNKPLTINGLDNVSPNGDNDYSVIKYEYDFYGNKTSYTDAIGNVQKKRGDKKRGDGSCA